MENIAVVDLIRSKPFSQVVSSNWKPAKFSLVYQFSEDFFSVLLLRIRETFVFFTCILEMLTDFVCAGNAQNDTQWSHQCEQKNQPWKWQVPVGNGSYFMGRSVAIARGLWIDFISDLISSWMKNVRPRNKSLASVASFLIHHLIPAKTSPETCTLCQQKRKAIHYSFSYHENTRSFSMSWLQRTPPPSVEESVLFPVDSCWHQDVLEDGSTVGVDLTDRRTQPWFEEPKFQIPRRSASQDRLHRG